MWQENKKNTAGNITKNHNFMKKRSTKAKSPYIYPLYRCSNARDEARDEAKKNDRINIKARKFIIHWVFKNIFIFYKKTRKKSLIFDLDYKQNNLQLHKSQLCFLLVILNHRATKKNEKHGHKCQNFFKIFNWNHSIEATKTIRHWKLKKIEITDRSLNLLRDSSSISNASSLWTRQQ